MALVRKRANGTYSLDFRWNGKPHIRALDTSNEAEANQIKQHEFRDDDERQRVIGSSRQHVHFVGM